jgi:hypothetical protein
MPAPIVIAIASAIIEYGINARTASIQNAAQFEYYQTLEEKELYELAIDLSNAFPQYPYNEWIVLLRAIARYGVSYPIPPAEFNPTLQAPSIEPVDYSICDRISKDYVQGGHRIEDQLYIPLWETDIIIRDAIDQGYSFDYAYEKTNLPNPPLAMHGCLFDVYREKFLFPDTGTLEFAAPVQTCRGFMDCYKEYTDGKSEWPWNPGERNIRMKIGRGLWSPSFDEQICIRSNFPRYNGDIYRAYDECGAHAIIPQFPGAMAYIALVLKKNPNVNIYRIIKSAYQIYLLYFVDPSGPGIITPTLTREELRRKREMLEESETPPWVYGLIAFGIGAVIMKGKR